MREVPCVPTPTHRTAPALDATARARITGTGHYVPSRVMTNAELESMVDTSDRWIVERTGIRERRIAAEGELTSDMAAEASRRALASAGIDATEIDMILVATFTPDVPLPATAVYVQTKIGARVDCPAVDLAAACAGFCYALSIADALVRTGGARHVLVIGAEMLSRVTDWQDRSTCVLFGDGAGAVVVSGGEGPGPRVISTRLHADGRHADALKIPSGGTADPASAESVAARRHAIAMNGPEVFKIAVRSLASASLAAIEAAGLTVEQVDWIVPHQANKRILEATAARMQVPMERFYLNLERYGNTSSASIPIALDEALRAGTIREGQNVLLCAFGGGVAWGSAVLRI